MSKIIVPKHHSVIDWDSELGSQYRSLDSTVYVSPPSSLHFVGGTPWKSACTLCRHSATLCLPQGEVRTWWRSNQTYDCAVTFRNQAPLGSATIINSYRTYSQSPYINVYRTVSGGSLLLAQLPYEFSENVWYHQRVVWWNGQNPVGEDALCIIVYMEIDGEWSKIGDTVYDTDNMWKDSDVNRVGLMAWFGVLRDRWFDDTEIWAPIA